MANPVEKLGRDIDTDAAAPAFIPCDSGVLCLPKAMPTVRSGHPAQDKRTHSSSRRMRGGVDGASRTRRKGCGRRSAATRRPSASMRRSSMAAAARAVFGQMNLDGAVKGEWPRHHITPHADVTLPRGWGTLPQEVRAALLREIPRAWLADALLLFGERSGWPGWRRRRFNDLAAEVLLHPPSNCAARVVSQRAIHVLLLVYIIYIVVLTAPMADLLRARQCFLKLGC